jgi:molybdopterin/thiamine biosynthesis adenylyltransferase
MIEAAIDADRYARQRIIPGWDQARLAKASVIVVGVGALGNEVAKNLALAGVGRLILCDPDTVSVSNLSRTVLLQPADVGQPKAATAAASLRTLVPGVIAEPRVADLGSGVGLGEFADAAVVLSCVDTIRARMRLLGRCALTGSPLVDGGTHPSGGEVRVRLALEDACYGCTLSAHERGVSDLPWSCFDMITDGPQPAHIATTALVASWATLAAINVILDTPPSYRMLAIDVVSPRTVPVVIERDPDCPLHRPLGGPIMTTPVSNQATVGQFVATLDPGDEPFAWERFSLGPRCGTCSPSAAARSDAGRCGRCAGLLRERFSQRLLDANAQARLCDLGVPPEDILPVRSLGGEYTCRRLSR